MKLWPSLLLNCFLCVLNPLTSLNEILCLAAIAADEKIMHTKNEQPPLSPLIGTHDSYDMTMAICYVDFKYHVAKAIAS